MDDGNYQMSDSNVNHINICSRWHHEGCFYMKCLGKINQVVTETADMENHVRRKLISRSVHASNRPVSRANQMFSDRDPRSYHIQTERVIVYSPDHGKSCSFRDFWSLNHSKKRALQELIETTYNCTSQAII